MSTIAAVLAFIFLDAPWRYLVAGGLLVVDVFEIYIWLRWRKQRSMTGAEGIVGARGTALTDCDPEGQVKVKGQIWKAWAADPVHANDDVVVTGVDGIRLNIARG